MLVVTTKILILANFLFAMRPCRRICHALTTNDRNVDLDICPDEVMCIISPIRSFHYVSQADDRDNCRAELERFVSENIRFNHQRGQYNSGGDTEKRVTYMLPTANIAVNMSFCDLCK